MAIILKRETRESMEIKKRHLALMQFGIFSVPAALNLVCLLK